MNCPDCGCENPEDARYCVKCGKDLAPQNICRQCGHELVEGAEFCPSCGQPVQAKGKDNPVKARKQKKNREAKIGAMQRLQTKYHLPINPIWIIVLLPLILLTISIYFLGFHVPKVCRPLIRTIEENGYSFGCDDELCGVKLQDVSSISSFRLEYRWDGGDAELADCEMDPDSPDALICTFPISSSEGGVMISAGDADCESTPVVYLDAERIAGLQENSQQKRDVSCAAFSKDVEGLVQQAQWSYEYDPLYFKVRLDGLTQYETLAARYQWGDSTDGKISCIVEPNNQYFCDIPAEEPITDLDVWLESGGCEEHLQKFGATEIDWQNFETCSPDYLEAMQPVDGNFYYACATDYCYAWVPNISAFTNAVIAYRFDGEEELIYASDCEWGNSQEGVMELSCSILFDEVPEGVTLYVDNDGCLVNLGYLNKGQIETSQESFSQAE
ncbi:zinc-ribbon domain-containing protein [Pelolinea submarina]|uniref:Double zinc ribbon protein n=1 Tax=Pelolinea submarina TaxID=913107 RepID=A0A347ZQJ8_9CHLR|nr:zinc-ribbon domain-containing protein [Pelolinea submarina]REG06087.1 double zinc ribbon protein [Pelolinea submarina]BBB47579.1 hypothetical protein Pelsub_P0806 [Pelolinea submarina]